MKEYIRIQRVYIQTVMSKVHYIESLISLHLFPFILYIFNISSGSLILGSYERQVQQWERSQALNVQVPIFIRNV